MIVFVTSTDFRQNIGKYLETCNSETVYILKHGAVVAKLVGIQEFGRDAMNIITGSLDIEKNTIEEE